MTLCKYNEGKDLTILYIVETTKTDLDMSIKFDNITQKECETLEKAIYIAQIWSEQNYNNISIMLQVKKGDIILVEDTANIDYMSFTDSIYQKQYIEVSKQNETLQNNITQYKSFLEKYHAEKQFSNFIQNPGNKDQSGLYWYEMLLRDVSPFCQPKNFIDVDHNKGKHGIVVYNRELLQSELDEYEMRPYAI